MNIPRTKPISPNTLIDDLHPFRFLKVIDFKERWNIVELIVTVANVQQEETIPKPADIDPVTNKPRIVWQPVLYFNTKGGEVFPRGYLLASRVDVDSLKKSTGVRTMGELVGKKILIKLGEHKKNIVLRISPEPVKE
jgi:hypothetical protein